MCALRNISSLKEKGWAYHRAPSLMTGAFAARLLLEWTARPWPWPLVVLGGALGVGLGALIGKRLTGRSGWPLLLLALYVVWPQRDFQLALQVLALVALTLILKSAQSTHLPIYPFAHLPIDPLTNLCTFTLSLLLYLFTTTLGVLPADSGEFQIVAPLLGVAHPPGYPLYTIVGWLFTHLLPVGSVAYRLNLLSAFLAAGALTLLNAATRGWARRLGAAPGAAFVGGLAAALTLGTVTTFWAQSGIANIRMPTVFCAALALYALSRHAETVSRQPSAVGGRDTWLWLLALALGLGLGHHPSLGFMGLFMLLYLLLIDPRLARQPRRWGRPLLIGGLSLLPLLYLPLRGAAGAFLAPPNLDTWDGFWFHVTAQGFEGDMFAFANAQDLPGRLALLPTLFRFQFNPALLATAALGALVLAWRERRLCLLLVGGLALHTFVSITYRAPQTVEYMMPAYLPLAILVGLTVAWLLSFSVLRLSSFVIFPALVLMAGLLNGLDHAPSFFALARDRSTREAMEPLLQQAPPGALILADWHWATPLWYLQRIEGQRPDVEVQYVYPVAGQAYDETWRAWVEASVGERPVLLTHAFEWPDYTLEPVGAGFRIHARPYTPASYANLTPLDALFGAPETRVRLVGYGLDRQSLSPGKQVELTLAWQAVGQLAAPPSFSARLWDASGQMRAQADRFLGIGYTPGEVRFERLVLPLYPDLPPGDYRLTVEVYSGGEAGFETWALADGAVRLELATLAVQPRRSPPVTLHPLDAPFSADPLGRAAAGPTLVGVDYDRSLPGALRVYLHWRGPATGSETVHVAGASVQLPALPRDAYHTAILDLPGDVTGRLTLALTGSDGQTRTVAGAWGWPLKTVSLPAPAQTARFVPLGDGLALVGVTATGEPLTLHLAFLALQPLTYDLRVSVRLWDRNGALRVQHDQQPALGAIPTLKWIRGSRVTDPHPLTASADLDVARGTLVVYEYFRGVVWVALDARMGETPLGEWAVSRTPTPAQIRHRHQR